MIGFFKNLFSGVLSFFIGLFGGKKSQDQPSLEAAKPPALPKKNRKRSGYFMELDEAEETTLNNGIQPVKDAAAKTVATAKNLTAKTIEVAAKPAKAESTAAKPAKAEPAQSPEPAASPASRVELVQTAEGVKAVPAKPVTSNNGQAAETTFAPKYLTPTNSNARRRPGPNMNPFLDMARQVKTPG